MQLRYGQQLDWLCAELQAMCKTYFLEKKSNAGITVPRKCDCVLIQRCPTFVSPEGDVVAALICHCTRDTLGHQHEWLSPCHHVRHHRACASRLSVLPLGSTSGPQFPIFQMICEEEKMENTCPRQNCPSHMIFDNQSFTIKETGEDLFLSFLIFLLVVQMMEKLIPLPNQCL